MPILSLTQPIDELQAKLATNLCPATDQLYRMAGQINQFRQTGTATISNPHILVFAGDHGLMADRVWDSPTSTTFQVVQAYISGKVAIIDFCRANDLKLLLCDVGVAETFAENTPEFVKFKIRPGTRNMRYEPAMTTDECEAALDAGRSLVNGVQYRDCNTVGFGELGMGNAWSAGLLLHRLTNLPLAQCMEQAINPTDSYRAEKLAVLQSVTNRYLGLSQPMEWLTAMGGFEIAAIVGGILQASENGMTVLIEGYLPTVAALIAHRLHETRP